MEGSLQDRLESYAVSVQRESGPVQNHTGYVTIAERNGRFEQEGPALDCFDGKMPEVLRLSSDAGTEFFYR